MGGAKGGGSYKGDSIIHHRTLRMVHDNLDPHHDRKRRLPVPANTSGLNLLELCMCREKGGSSKLPRLWLKQQCLLVEFWGRSNYAILIVLETTQMYDIVSSDIKKLMSVLLPFQ